jgi:hypothetical protein
MEFIPLIDSYGGIASSTQVTSSSFTENIFINIVI